MPARIQLLLGTCLLATGVVGGTASLSAEDAGAGAVLDSPVGTRAVQGESNDQAGGRYCRPLLSARAEAEGGQRQSGADIPCQDDARARRMLVST